MSTEEEIEIRAEQIALRIDAVHGALTDLDWTNSGAAAAVIGLAKGGFFGDWDGL